MKKLLCVISAALVIVSAFSACSSDKGGDESNKISYSYDSHLTVNDSAKRAYESLCDAVVAGENTVYFNNALIQDVNQLFYTSFPLNSLVEKIEPSDDNSSFVITYKNDAEQHKKLVKDFVKKTESIMKECGYGKVSNNEYILNVYSYIAKNIEVDYSYTTAYDAIVSNLGTSASYSAAFEYLLRQAGIDSSHIYAPSVDEVLFFSVVEIDGEEYLFAPYNEHKETEGNGLSYFGMVYNDALTMSIIDSLRHTNGDIFARFDNSNRFADFRGTDRYTYEDGVITAGKSSGEQHKVEF